MSSFANRMRAGLTEAATKAAGAAAERMGAKGAMNAVGKIGAANAMAAFRAGASAVAPKISTGQLNAEAALRLPNNAVAINMPGPNPKRKASRRANRKNTRRANRKNTRRANRKASRKD